LFGVTRQITNAGEIILGEYTPISACNYSLGPNAVLPTGGFAKTYSALSVRDFIKTSSVSFLTKAAYTEMRAHVINFAAYEGFSSHALALQARRFRPDGIAQPANLTPPVAPIPEVSVSSNTPPPLEMTNVPLNTPSGLGYHIIKASPTAVACKRLTRESCIWIDLDMGERYPDINEKLQTPLHFLNHMLEHISWRSCLNIGVRLEITHYPFGHVICEDVGMTLGYAFAELWRQQKPVGVNGEGEAIGCIDEALARATLGFEDRAQFCFTSAVRLHERVEDMLAVDLNNFFAGFVQGAKCTIHLDILKGDDPHHIWESAFRAFGRCLREVFAPNPWRKGTTPGVKGI